VLQEGETGVGVMNRCAMCMDRSSGGDVRLDCGCDGVFGKF